MSAIMTTILRFHDNDLILSEQNKLARLNTLWLKFHALLLFLI